jgi:hypothetical protein
MSKEKQLYEILRALQKGEIGTDLAHLQILRLFSVVERSKHLIESDKLCRMNQNFVCNCIDDSKCPNF